MIELEENKRKLSNIKQRIQNIGESLWLAQNRKKITKFRS